jgi:hypothetical protein
MRRASVKDLNRCGATIAASWAEPVLQMGPSQWKPVWSLERAFT